MKFKVEGKEISAEKMRVGEMCEAEKYLQMNMESGSGAAIAICLFVAKRRDEPAMPVGAVAQWVMNVEMTDMETVEEESADPLDGNGTGDPDSLPISGTTPSALTG